mgnify:CR=1 FL=1
MGELKDYFCTPEQSQKLKELGCLFAPIGYFFKHEGRDFLLSYMEFAEEEELRAPLRAQALDFFREKGYETIIEKYEAGYGYAIRFKVKKDTIIYLQGDFTPYEESESMLIDRLIEMELDKEVQDGN